MENGEHGPIERAADLLEEQSRTIQLDKSIEEGYSLELRKARTTISRLRRLLQQLLDMWYPTWRVDKIGGIRALRKQGFSFENARNFYEWTKGEK